MQHKYRRLWLYALVVASATTLWLGYEFRNASDWPILPIALGFVAFQLFVWHYGFPTPYAGLFSLERVPQVATLLIFSAPVAAFINATASLVFPFTNRHYSQGSPVVATLRALHNAAMTASMTLCAGYAYHAMGGVTPLIDLQLRDVLPLLALALVMQAVNMLMMFIYFLLDQRDVSRIFTFAYAGSDLYFVPAGILTGLLFNSVPLAAFVLFVALLVLLVITYNGFAKDRSILEAKVHELDKAGQAGRALSGAQRLDELAERVRDEIATLFKFDAFSFVLVDEERREFDIRFSDKDGHHQPRQRAPGEHALYGYLLRRGEVLLGADGHASEVAHLGHDGNDVFNSLIGMALRHGGNTVALLCVRSRANGVYVPTDMTLMRRLAEAIAPTVADVRAFEALDDYKQRLETRVAERTAELAALNRHNEELLDELRRKSQELERQSKEDALTGLANRRCLDMRLAEEVQRVVRYNGRLSVVLADLDHFKRVNDCLGHAIGDDVLQTLAAIMRRQCRALDVIARYGGEEFALVLPETTREGAELLSEKLRIEVERFPWHMIHPELQVTLSAGVAGYVPGMNADTLLELADANLYMAKKAGRNRIVA